MTTAQYLFQTIINPDVVYKLLPGCEPMVQIESVRFLQCGFSNVEPFLVLQPRQQTELWCRWDRLPGPVGCRCLLGLVCRGSTVDSWLGIRSGCFYPATTTFQNHQLVYIGEKRIKCKHILQTQQSTSMSKKREGETIRMALKMFLGTEYGRCKLPISVTAEKCRFIVGGILRSINSSKWSKGTLEAGNI